MLGHQYPPMSALQLPSSSIQVGPVGSHITGVPHGPGLSAGTKVSLRWEPLEMQSHAQRSRGEGARSHFPPTCCPSPTGTSWNCFAPAFIFSSCWTYLGSECSGSPPVTARNSTATLRVAKALERALTDRASSMIRFCWLMLSGSWHQEEQDAVPACWLPSVGELHPARSPTPARAGLGSLHTSALCLCPHGVMGLEGTPQGWMEGKTGDQQVLPGAVGP